MNSLISPNAMPSSVSSISESPPLWAIDERKRSGLILCKPHYADFAGPGALIPYPIQHTYVAIVAIGTPEIVEVNTHEARQRAYSSRIQWSRWLNKIVNHPEPTQRVEKLFAGFEAFFGDQIVASLSDEVLALLAGVLPHTVAAARQPRHRPPSCPAGAEGRMISIQTLDLTQGHSVKPDTKEINLRQALSVAPNLQRLPCSA